MAKTKMLLTNAEKNAEKAENLTFCSGIKVLHIRNSIEQLLAHIGRCGMFEEYTLHDISHIDEMLGIVDWLIPERTKTAMTYAEWLMLTLGIYFHDLGMLVTKKEFENRMKSGFKEYRESIEQGKDNADSEANLENDKFLYQEFVRENHAKRICAWINGENNSDLGDAETVVSEIQAMFSTLDKKFKRDLAKVCESHHRDDIYDFEQYKTKILYGNSENERVNLNYICIILRIADLLHITRDRTPSISMRIINISNPKSILEWKKQKAVQAVSAQERRNEDGNIDHSLEKNTIEVTAFFEGTDSAEAYFGLSTYLKYTQNELAKCNAIVNKAKKTEGTHLYDFPWKRIDESNIETLGFESKKLQFTLAQENILQLLVGHTLYNDSSVVVRELVQNAIDAVKLQKEIDKKKTRSKLEGKIIVSWDSTERVLSFIDNGTGMTIGDIENYLLKVGASKYKEESFKKQFPEFSSISHFGIGILTCFMIADEIEITTSSIEQKEASIVKLRNVNGNYLLSKAEKNNIDQRIRKHGTIIQLHVRNDVNMTELYKDLTKWIVLPEIPVYLIEDSGEEIQIGFNSPKEVLERSLEEAGIRVDNENYTIYEGVSGNVSVAFAMRHLKYLSDWTLMSVSELRKSSEEDGRLPIGTCIEGIRVEFTTPGYTGPTILAIANVKNGKYRTNVARSAIELDANKEIVSEIYKVYAKYLKDQMDALCNMKFSQAWAINECYYLMKPLLSISYDHGFHNRTEVEPIDGKVLTQSLADLKSLIVEDEGKREYLSANEVKRMDTINVFECKMLDAVQSLFQEIQSDATLSSIMHVVCGGDNFLNGVKNVVCNYSTDNVLHQFALREKEVSNIVINREQRRILLTFGEKSGRWERYETFTKQAIYIPINDFNIIGLDNEIGVRTFGGIYLNKRSEFCDYLIDTIRVLSDGAKGTIYIEAFLRYIFQSDVLENVYLNADVASVLRQPGRHLGGGLNSEIIERIDLETFSKVVLAKKHSLFSIYNWSRDEKRDYMLNEVFLEF